MRWLQKPAGTWLITSIVLFLFAGTVGLNAQAAEGGEDDENGGPAWQLEGLKRCFCVDFLMEPEPADKRLPKGYRPVPAHRFTSLHPALERLVEDEPDYRDWIPSAICAFGSSAIVMDGRRIGGRDPGSREMIGMWGIAGTPEGEDVDDLWVLHEFLTTNHRIKQSAEGSLLKLRVIDAPSLAPQGQPRIEMVGRGCYGTRMVPPHGGGAPSGGQGRPGEGAPGIPHPHAGAGFLGRQR